MKRNMLFYSSRANISWNEAAAWCANVSGHLPFLRKYHYGATSVLDDQFEYVSAIGPIDITSGKIGFGDITFIGLSRKVSRRHIPGNFSLFQ